MTEKEIQEIVQLIVKRILQQSYGEKTCEKILLVLGSAKDELFADEYFENKKSECLRTTIIASDMRILLKVIRHRSWQTTMKELFY